MRIGLAVCYLLILYVYIIIIFKKIKVNWLRRFTIPLINFFINVLIMYSCIIILCTMQYAFK